MGYSLINSGMTSPVRAVFHLDFCSPLTKLTYLLKCGQRSTETQIGDRCPKI